MLERIAAEYRDLLTPRMTGIIEGYTKIAADPAEGERFEPGILTPAALRLRVAHVLRDMEQAGQLPSGCDLRALAAAHTTINLETRLAIVDVEGLAVALAAAAPSRPAMVGLPQGGAE